MSYELLADTIDKNKIEIGKRVATRIKEEQIEPYSNFPELKLSGMFAAAIAKVIDYLRTGDLEVWKAYTHQISQTRFEEGFDPNALTKTFLIIISDMKEVVNKELDGQITDRTKTSFYRRIEGIQTSGYVAISTTAINTKKLR